MLLVFYSNPVNLRVKFFIRISILMYLIADLIIGYRLGFMIFPGHILNLEGLFISAMSANLLLNLPVNPEKPYTSIMDKGFYYTEYITDKLLKSLNPEQVKTPS